jgi:hypothetical protein
MDRISPSIQAGFKTGRQSAQQVWKKELRAFLFLKKHPEIWHPQYRGGHL